MTKNLVEQAKNIKPERTPYKITQEVIDLALAWKNDEVSIGQIQKALNIKEPNKIYAILARALKANKESPKEQKIGPPSKNMVVVDNTIKVAHKSSVGKSPDEAPSKY